MLWYDFVFLHSDFVWFAWVQFCCWCYFSHYDVFVPQEYLSTQYGTSHTRYNIHIINIIKFPTIGRKNANNNNAFNIIFLKERTHGCTNDGRPFDIETYDVLNKRDDVWQWQAGRPSIHMYCFYIILCTLILCSMYKSIYLIFSSPLESNRIVGSMHTRTHAHAHAHVHTVHINWWWEDEIKPARVLFIVYLGWGGGEGL